MHSEIFCIPVQSLSVIGDNAVRSCNVFAVIQMVFYNPTCSAGIMMGWGIRFGDWNTGQKALIDLVPDVEFVIDHIQECLDILAVGIRGNGVLPFYEVIM